MAVTQRAPETPLPGPSREVSIAYCWQVGGQLQWPGAVCTPRDPTAQGAEELTRAAVTQEKLGTMAGTEEACLNSKG